MKFVLSTALSAGMALTGSVAFAAPEGDQSSDPSNMPESSDQIIEEQHHSEDTVRRVRPSTQSTDPSRVDPSQQPLTEPSAPMNQPDSMGQPDSTMPDSLETAPSESAPYEPVAPRSEATEPQRIEQQTVIVTEDQPEEKRGPGLSISAGGGVFDFSDEDARDATSTGGAYQARLAIGTRRPVGLEVAYIGTAQALNTPGVSGDAALIGNGIEGALRINILSAAMFQPYIVGGAAWKRYDVTNTSVNTSSVRDSDDVLEIPVGAGVAFRYSGLVLDLRGDYRFASQEDLLTTNTDGPGLDNWDATLRAGFEF